MSATRGRVVLALVLAVVASLAVVVQTAPPAAAAPALPADFVLRDIETGLRPPNGADPGDMLTDFAYLPDESILVTGKYGKVMWLPRAGTPRQVAAIPTHGAGDLGLTGLAVAPDYATSHTVYTVRAVPASGPGSGDNGVLRLSRWTVTTAADGTPTGLADETTLVQMPANSYVHGISGLVAAPDGTVWVSVGDNADFRTTDRLALRALDPDDPHGKLLHVTRDGAGVPTNPYYDPARPKATRSLVYASGFRSPFRVSLEPGTGRPILGDVGNGRHEEIDLVAPGNSYGWPCWEGLTRTPGFRDMPECAGVATASPLYSYPHVGGSSVTGGVVYTGESYPERYRGRYFFGDYTDKMIWTLGYDARGQVTTPPEQNGFGSGIGAPVKFASVPTGGDIVYADISSAKLRRIVYSPGNAPPAPVIRSTVDPATRTVTFDASETTDPNGDEPTYTWDFGDGATGTGETVTHTYPADRESAEVTLTARDPAGATGTATATVYPGNHAPALTLRAPDPAQRFAVGDVVAAEASATDTEDGPVDIRWSTVVIHCAAVADCHLHPGAQQEGPAYRLTFEGHPGDSRIEVTAIATDSRGATTTETFTVHPKQRRVTIQSNAAAAFTIGDEETASGLFTVGTPLTIIAPATALDGVATFDRWGDGSTERVRQLTLPDADQVLEVGYLTPIDRRYAGEEALRALLGAPTDAEQGDPTVRWRPYERGRLYWSPSTGVHALNGAILTKYLGLGGHLSLGLPTTDETAGADGGRYNLLSRNQGIYWHPRAGSHFVVGAIHTRYRQMGADESVLGYPTTDEGGAPNGRFNHFQRGSIYYTPAHGAHEIFGAILGRWNRLGGAPGIGFPISNELRTSVGGGTYQNFQYGAIYWSADTGAWELIGAIRARWNALGRERSYLGFPTSGEFGIPGGRRSNFQHGYITYDAATGRVTDRRY
ncbi:MAG TPA: PQQ-dependent sugar dehydrogenase [Actinophytocola sp.]|nr:PQQ-dependent sugar dehydrogenase [Actinophytocola sp.]